jgi:hypothetical protein
MRILLLSFFLCTALFSRADYWDNLTYAEAERVVLELKKNPFIFQYCDCCGHSMVLVEVQTTEIIPCSWLEDAYSVRYTYRSLAAFSRADGDAALGKPEPTSPEGTTELLYMNYSWTLDPESGKAAAYFKAVPYTYYENQMCSVSFAYPSPKALKSYIKGTAYKAWYKQTLGRG